MDSTLFVLIRLLNKLKIAHDEEEIRLQLVSEPQYPSLLSITNILDFLNIKYTPVQTTFEYLKNSELNSIIHINKNSSSNFATIENIIVIPLPIMMAIYTLYQYIVLKNYGPG